MKILGIEFGTKSDLILLGLMIAGIIYVIRKTEKEEKQELKGFDYRKLGHPRTDEERLARHRSIYGSSTLPPRGTGLRNYR